MHLPTRIWPVTRTCVYCINTTTVGNAIPVVLLNIIPSVMQRLKLTPAVIPAPPEFSEVVPEEESLVFQESNYDVTGPYEDGEILEIRAEVNSDVVGLVLGPQVASALENLNDVDLTIEFIKEIEEETDEEEELEEEEEGGSEKPENDDISNDEFLEVPAEEEEGVTDHVLNGPNEYELEYHAEANGDVEGRDQGHVEDAEDNLDGFDLTTLEFVSEIEDEEFVEEGGGNEDISKPDEEEEVMQYKVEHAIYVVPIQDPEVSTGLVLTYDNAEALDDNKRDEVDRANQIIQECTVTSSLGLVKEFCTFGESADLRKSKRATKGLDSNESKRREATKLQNYLLNLQEDSFYIKMHPEKGRTVYTSRPISRNDYVLEYKGELIENQVAFNRWEQESEEKGSFMMFFKFDEHKYCIDSTVEDNSLGRLISHSRKGNLYPKCIPINGKPRIFLRAKVNIPVDSELSYDYGERNANIMKKFPWLRY